MIIQHPKKVVREALEEAQVKGFIVQKAKGKGHAWGFLISTCTKAGSLSSVARMLENKTTASVVT